MSRVPETLKQDVFLSYAHLDNLPDLPTQQCWISIFQTALRNRLSRELGRPAKVWWDQRELDGVRQFDDVIREACDASTVMVAIVSPRYVDSDSCKKELDYFTCRGHTTQGGSKPLFIVKTTPVNTEELDESAHPALRKAITTTLGYAFRYEDESTKRQRELHIYDPALSPIYQRRLEEIAQDISSAIRAVEGRRNESRVPPRGSGPILRGTGHDATDRVQAVAPVFFAAASSDVVPVRDAIHAELVDRGVPVCAPTVWSDEYGAMRDQVLRSVEHARLAIQVVGATYGRRPEGTEKSVPELQFDLLEEVARARPVQTPLIRLVWLSSLAEERSEKQTAFIERLRTYEGWGQADEFLTGTREDLAERIMAKWQTLEAERLASEARCREARQVYRPSATGSTNDESGVHRVYVISADRDHERARAVEEALQLSNWEILSAAEVSADCSDAAERERQHQEYLAQSDAFVIYHGDAKFSWVRAQADAARKANGLRGAKPCFGSLYVARPMEGRKATYRLLGIQRINDVYDDTARNIEPLLERLVEVHAMEQGRGRAGGAT